MKIITWNCNMAFRRKAEMILSHKPDILIVPECEHPDKLLFDDPVPKPADALWFGKNRNKGIGIFSYSDFRFKVLRNHNKELQLIIPVKVSNARSSFLLFAIWANNPNDKDGQYVTQVWKALHHYKKYVRHKQTLLIGDFNSNTIWDKPRREGNHSTVVKKLESKKIYSAYHKFFNQQQGQELHPTLYMYRNKQKPYHIDYCFASEDMLAHLGSVEVGAFESWCKFSDHVPVIVTFNPSIFNNEAVDTTNQST